MRLQSPLWFGHVCEDCSCASEEVVGVEDVKIDVESSMSGIVPIKSDRLPGGEIRLDVSSCWSVSLRY
jgi:hypothetical protein